YAGGWLVSAGDWGNTSRVFDAALGSITFGKSKWDTFAGSVVLADGGRIDRHKPGEHLYGTDFSTKSLRNTTLEAFLLAKTQLGVTGELGARGDGHTYVTGVRATGKVSASVDYAGLAAHEWGSYATDRISAWAGYGIVGWTVGRSARKPRFS